MPEAEEACKREKCRYGADTGFRMRAPLRKPPVGLPLSPSEGDWGRLNSAHVVPTWEHPWVGQPPAFRPVTARYDHAGTYPASKFDRRFQGVSDPAIRVARRVLS